LLFRHPGLQKVKADPLEPGVQEDEASAYPERLPFRPGMNLELFPYAPERDLYRLLQVEPNADTEAVIVACRRLARTCHPDRNASPRAHEEMLVVNAARGLLTDPERRASYDRERISYLAARDWDGGWPPAPRPLGVRLAWGRSMPWVSPGLCPACGARVEPAYRYCCECGNRLLTMSRRAG
jgi:DnaJ domain